MPGRAVKSDTPTIDARTYDKVVDQTRTLVKHYTGWNAPDGQPDAGSALIDIFAHLMTLVIDRLNRAPEKNFLAFLNLIGTEVRPPRAARVPLTFRLAQGSPVDALVPARTQVAAPPEAGEEKEVVFETDADLVVTRSELVAAFAHDPARDTYADVTALATGKVDGPFHAFAGATPVEHSLYLACDDFLLLPGPRAIVVTIAFADSGAAAGLPPTPATQSANAFRANALRTLGRDGGGRARVAWQFWTGAAWKDVAPTVGGQNVEYVATFADLPTPGRCTVNGVEAGWLRAVLTPLTPAEVASLPPGAPPPSEAARLTVKSIRMAVHISRTGVVPTRAFANGVPLDLSRDFFPLGEQPRLNDAFYLALPEELAKPKAQLAVHVSPSNPTKVSNANAPKLTWEVWNGDIWEKVNATGAPADAVNLVNLSETGGNVTIPLPAKLAARAVNGEAARWVRARLTGGHFGEPPVPQVTSETRDGHVTVKVTMTGGYSPPSLAALTVSCSDATESGAPTSCFTSNAFTWADRTEAARTGTPSFPLFTPGVETGPALYLGFNHPFDNRPVTLYLRVEAPDPPDPGALADVLGQAAPGPAPRIVWEYRAADGWRPLNAADDTDAFGDSGEVRFIGPGDLAERREFDRAGYWIRARPEGGAFLVPPRLRRVSLNTTWATQATTLQDEVLGSSTGEADQILHTIQAPVLAGQRLEVREPEAPPDSEQAALMATEGTDAITISPDEAGHPQDIWVRWHAVPDFHASGPRDRHYAIDALSGEVRFGDGRQGLVPPAGRNNVRMALYRTGGGPRGNREAGSITQLKTTVPYVEGALNPEAASGGADEEDIEDVKTRGPKTLRHRGRAVTAQDFEDLAYEASPEVARALALMPVFDPISAEWLPVWHLPLKGTGEIAVDVTWESEGDAVKLAASISGPGHGNPIARAEDSKNFRVSHTVTEFVAGDLWRVVVENVETNPQRKDVATNRFTVTIAYPGDKIHEALNAPATKHYAPTATIRQIGRVELVIVPRDPVAQPSPSVSLLTRVRVYLLARSAPTLALLVTGPEWVTVTVTAQVVPTSPGDADRVRAAALAALDGFLHPLTGGLDGQGWRFGRGPHRSDVYAVLAGVPGLRYVRSLGVDSQPRLPDVAAAVDGPSAVGVLSPDRRERFLIHSGHHVITAAAP